MREWSVARKTSLGFVSALIVVLVTMLGIYAMQRTSQSSAAAIAASIEKIAGQERLYSALLAALFNQRNYVVNGGEADLRERDDARNRLLQELGALEATHAGNASTERQRITQLDADINETLALLDKIITDRRATGTVASLPPAVRLRALGLLKDIRQTLDKMQANEHATIAALQIADRTRAARSYLLLAIATAVCISGIGWWLFKVLEDVETRDRVSGRLSQTHRYLDSLMDNIPTMIFAKDAHDLRFVQLNQAGEDLLGIPRTEMLGKSDRDFFPAEQAEQFIAKDRAVLSQGEIVDIPAEEIDTRTHGRRILHTRKVPVRDADGVPILLLGISMDITEQKRSERDIVKLNTELKRNAALLAAANQDLEGFCYSVSHDLRTPLRAIDGFARLLEENIGQSVSTEAQRFIRTIRANTERMGRLIDDLLEFSRLGRQPLASAAVDMTNLARKVVEEVSQGHVGNAPQVEIAALPLAMGDARALHHVWLNLVDNAVKYSSNNTQPHIVVTGEARSGEVVYCVRDNGIGFDMQYYDQLFGVFQRLHTAQDFPGTGVGLAIVQRIVARHGGRVWAHSTPGEGAAFSFSLPLTEPAPGWKSVN